jgi:hypothetical protein
LWLLPEYHEKRSNVNPTPRASAEVSVPSPSNPTHLDNYFEEELPMANDGTYTIIQEESDSSSASSSNEIASLYRLFRDLGEPRKKGKKKKKDKLGKALKKLLKGGEKDKRKSKKSGKKPSKRAFKYGRIEKASDTAFDIVSHATKRYFDSKWPV